MVLGSLRSSSFPTNRRLDLLLEAKEFVTVIVIHAGGTKGGDLVVRKRTAQKCLSFKLISEYANGQFGDQRPPPEVVD